MASPSTRIIQRSNHANAHKIKRRPAMYKQIFKIIISLMVSVTFLPASYGVDFTINKVNGAKEELILSILELAISKVDPSASLHQLDEELPLGRLATAVEDKQVDIIWAGSSAEYDKRLLAIRVPLLKGLLGHRVFIIKPENQSKFDSIKNIQDLTRLRAGLNSRWGSTKVVKNSGLNVVESASYENLFSMLDSGRFDYYPRAVHEPWEEILARPDLDLTIEKNLLVIYPYAMQFYVRADNVPLKEYLEKGVEMAIADGSFDELFFNNPMIKKAIAETGFKRRTKIYLPNPYLHKDTPLDRKELWLDVDNL